MGVFKEQAQEFERLYEAQYNTGLAGFTTNNPENAENLAALREWMKDMAGLKLTQTINGNQREDSYFVAWEMDEGMVRGTRFVITTRKIRDYKHVSLDGNPMTMAAAEFNRRF